MHMRMILALVGVTVLAVGVRGEENTPKALSERLQQNADFPPYPTQQQQIEMLREETLEQSLYRLKDVNLFFCPGPPDPGHISFESPPIEGGPLSANLERKVVDVLMGNRRVLKLYRDLAKLPTERAARLLNAQILELLPLYCAAFQSDENINSLEHYLRETAELEKNRPGSSYTSVGYVTNTPNPNEVTLSGLRNALLSLVWISGALGLEETHGTLLKLAEEAKLQRDALYGDEIHHHFYKESILQHLSIYNRTVLCMALLRTAPPSALHERFAAQSKTYRQVPFDSPQMSYNGRAEETDPSQDMLSIKYFENMLDDDFDLLLRERSKVAG